MGIRAGGPNVNKFSMNLLGWKEITTERQQKNGTRIFQLPIKMYGQYIEVGSFETGYVRRMNGGYTPYQLNKCENYDHFYPEYKWCDDWNTSIKTGKYRKHVCKRRILIPNEVDRIEYLITYCLKNYYINQANEIENGNYITKWEHEYEMKNGSLDRVRELQTENRELRGKVGDFLKCEDTDCMTNFKYSGGQIENMENGDIFVHEQHAYWNKLPSSVEVIVDGHRYKIK
jgi:hypothetical protein